ncbi:MAG: hypothetical protein Q9164_005666 [Protoblastenia rupestris]
MMFNSLKLRPVLQTKFLSTTLTRLTSTQPPSTQQPQSTDNATDSTKDPSSPSKDSPPKTLKTQAEADAELRQKLEAISGGGGEAGLELENGQPVAMKRGVKDNMFRLI